MKSFIVARVSTHEQDEAGNSIPAQIERMESYCERKSFTVSERYRIQESAYKQKRDAFDELVQDIESAEEKIIVCFDKVDRLSRNVFDTRIPKLYDMAVEDRIELHFVSDGQVLNSKISAVEKFQFGINLGLAKYFSDAISDNTKRANEQMRREGRFGGKAPFGYKNVQYDAAKRTRKGIEPDHQTKEYAVAMYEMYASGNHSVSSIADWLNSQGVRTTNEKRFRTSNVYSILKNPFYYGEMKTLEGILPHCYEPIISRSLYVTVQDMFARRSKNPTKISYKREFVFSGLLKCHRCGCSMSAEIKKGKYVYYSCTNAKKICERIYINEDTLLKPLKTLLNKLVLSDEQIMQVVGYLKKTHDTQSLYHKRNLQKLQNDYLGSQERLDKLLDLLMDGSITNEDYERKRDSLAKKQNEMQVSIDNLSQANKSFHITAQTILSLAQKAPEIFERSETQEKRRLLQYLLQNSTVDGKKPLFVLRKPFDTIFNVSGYPIRLRGQDSNL